ncbi:MAG: cob(I)yrinic acid a,c-diamide adenosyltransferase [Planctomycetaceae bacterium]|nr:cob(I)yrinic acid a,c-diamide adenosyltransferase [Planctomycetaceae bacterium]
MVHLDRITTKTGDAGQTYLGNGQAVPKDDSRIEVLGTLDELNAHLGVVLTWNPAEPYAAWFRQMQHDLFDLGADLCFPEDCAGAPVRISSTQVERLDAWLEQMHQDLPSLSSFILPGGSPLTAAIHLARTVCRRAERRLWTLIGSGAENSSQAIYLNRLSDVLFQLARLLETPETPISLWKPSPVTGKVDKNM